MWRELTLALMKDGSNYQYTQNPPYFIAFMSGDKIMFAWVKLTSELIYPACFLPAEDQKINRENEGERVKNNRVFQNVVI